MDSATSSKVLLVLVILSVVSDPAYSGVTRQPKSKPVESRDGVVQLRGYYELRAAGQADTLAVAGMRIFKQVGRAFAIGIDTPTGEAKYDWDGKGEVNGRTGYYDWQFPDGKKGRTTFTVDSEGRLHGKVRGGGIDWDYVADYVGDTVPVEKFKIAGFHFQGNTIVSTDELRKVGKQYENQEVTLDDLAALVDALKAVYVQRGHPETAIEIPPQAMRRGEDILVNIKEGTRPAQRPPKR